MSVWQRLIAEPPFRLLSRECVRHFVRHPGVRARWGADPYPAYRWGIWEAGRLARGEGIPRISVIELGVAGGRGLLAMQRYAADTEANLGVRIEVIGFDAGEGLPAITMTGDYRDHPDVWQPGDYRMDSDALRAKLDPKRTTLILGNVRDTIPRLLEEKDFAPVGFASFDLDLYSSTRDALVLLGSPRRKMLRQTPVLFDDTQLMVNHRWAGQRLAIKEFNAAHDDVKIDLWYALKADKPFPEVPYWDKLMLAHDLKRIGDTVVRRAKAVLAL